MQIDIENYTGNILAEKAIKSKHLHTLLCITNYSLIL